VNPQPGRLRYKKNDEMRATCFICPFFVGAAFAGR
jgi:hypothetical protein